MPREGDIWATIGPFAYRTSTANSVANDSPYRGGGLVVEGDVDYNGGVEIAMFYEDKLYVRRGAPGEVAGERIKRMYVTTGYRHWLTPWFSGALAFFSSYSMGDVRTVLDRVPAGKKLPTTAGAITEYGMDLSLQTELWSNGSFAAVADARYSYSMSKKSKEDADLYGVLLGFKWLVPKSR